MSLSCRPSTIEDETNIASFLARIFAAEPDSPLIDPALLRWKYWQPRRDFTNPRSLVMEKDGRIVAHVGLWPVAGGFGVKSELGVQMIDWASDPGTPGAGVSLLQRLTRSYDFVYSIGGSDITRTILPRFGFRTVAQALVWARPIRPWRQMFHHPVRDIRLPLRLARNIWWSRTPAGKIPNGWTAVEAGDGALEDVQTLTGRDASFFRFLRQCPVARFQMFQVLHNGAKAGFFVLSIVGEQSRLAGVWLCGPSSETWRTAFELAQDTALRVSGACEITAAEASEASAVAATQAGLRLRGSQPVFLFRKDCGASALTLRYQLIDSDACFLRGRQTEFLT